MFRLKSNELSVSKDCFKNDKAVLPSILAGKTAFLYEFGKSTVEIFSLICTLKHYVFGRKSRSSCGISKYKALLTEVCCGLDSLISAINVEV
ncbi:hypothetical protein BI350_08845 [Sporosarcina ureilytica]|uniref:Uncharacterized protein n=1 Tax=Sporosarcina ureilytica TaxID=298596 RepID=A0A1D8JFZ1_9BACL|nr:hypothetical protein BI350_08845 [Sporosarcina ureilytica]